jgi:hypothetical protein
MIRLVYKIVDLKNTGPVICFDIPGRAGEMFWEDYHEENA